MRYSIKPPPVFTTRFMALLVVLLLLVSCASDSSADVESAADDSTSVPTTEPVDEAPTSTADTSAADEAPNSTADTSAAETDAAADHDHDADADHAEDHEQENDTGVADNDSDATTVAVANASYLDSYTLVDESFGTMVTVTVDGSTRTIESNTLPNHETGDFPNAGNPNSISEQDRSWTLTTEPTYTGNPQIVRETGVALNGVKFEPGTAEAVSCTSGESYRIEGLQEAFDLGMDFNNAHVQPTGEYHYHGVSDLMVDAFANDGDLVVVGFAADGHTIYYSKSNAYLPSYSLSSGTRVGTDCAYRTGPVDIDGSTPDGTYVSDWIYVEGQGELDQCNGTIIGDEYAYVITEQYPYISRCLMGEVANAAPGGGGEGGGAAPGGAAPGGAPDLAAAAEALGMTEQELQDVLGGPPPDIGAAAAALGMTEEDLMALLAEHGVAPPSNS